VCGGNGGLVVGEKARYAFRPPNIVLLANDAIVFRILAYAVDCGHD
jgi:hypothetical protein